MNCQRGCRINGSAFRPQEWLACKSQSSRCHKYAVHVTLTRYERGLRFLIRRHHVSNEDECFSQVVNASFAAVLNGEVSRDVDLAGIIQHNFRRVLLGTSLAIQDTETSNRNLPETARAMGDLVLKLKMFKSHQFNALFRFYSKKRAPPRSVGIFACCPRNLTPFGRRQRKPRG